ncbi:uncharacterized protein [Euphorbia lathyris]|uniref:uncharacterized protein isoform X2 n=1 Tax=Euphorbia lathyris TaxID=212925 RepID=UPI00331438E3
MAFKYLVSRVSASIRPVGYRRAILGAISPVLNASAKSYAIGVGPPGEDGCFRQDRFPRTIPGCPYEINLHPMVSRNELLLIRHAEDEQIEIDVEVHRVNDASELHASNDTTADVKRISMRINIKYGDEYQNCMRFGVHAFADNPDKIFITYLSISDGTRKPRGHLEPFEGYFEDRGICPKGLSYLFDYVPKLQDGFPKTK